MTPQALFILWVLPTMLTDTPPWPDTSTGSFPLALSICSQNANTTAAQRTFPYWVTSGHFA